MDIIYNASFESNNLEKVANDILTDREKSALDKKVKDQWSVEYT